MCISCGCSEGKVDLNNDLQKHEIAQHLHNTQNQKYPGHQHLHDDNIINLEASILNENDKFARQNHAFFVKKMSLALNLLSSPGAGKTTLLETTIRNLNDCYPLCVIEGDQHTELDAKRVRDLGIAAYQINTGKGCHLDAHMVHHALEDMIIEDGGVIFIENVGNLICPALFNLGEHFKIVIIATTEGEDKPLKYPNMFHSADLIIINKIDLLAYLDFDLAKCVENIRKINTKSQIIQLSATKNDGVGEWINWLNAAYHSRAT